MTRRKLLAAVLTLLMLLQTLPAVSLSLFAADSNVALGKPVSAGGSWKSSAVDGDRGTYWDSGSLPATLTVDLEEVFTISKITVVPYFDGSRSYTFNVYTSEDGQTFSLYASKTDDSVGTSNGYTYRLPAQARYVRVELLTNTANPSGHVNELEVYGSRAGAPATDPDDPDNLAYNKPTRSTSTTGYPSAAVDGKDGTYFTGRDFPCSLDVDLLQNYDLTSVKITMPSGKWSYDLYVSLDGVRFEKVASHAYESVNASGDVYDLSGITGRVLRVNVTESSGGLGGSSRISEIRAYGSLSETPVTPTREKMEFESYESWLARTCGVTLPENYDVTDTYTEEDTVQALYGIVTRTVGARYADWFTFDVQPGASGKDYYEAVTEDGKTKITGNNGSSIAVGLNAFFKLCGVQISQQTANVTMPETMPVLDQPLRGESPYSVRYAYNYCTLSYTMPFYGFDDWQRELDYLALSGVNVILDTTATEALWVSYLQKFGYGADDAKNYVCGYAYKAWWLMGNLENYGGNVSDEWIVDTLEMARVNQRFMTVLGIRPCLQGFMGTLPTTFADIAGPTLLDKGYADVGEYLVAQGSWSGFTRPPLLKTTYDGYKELADVFYDTQKELYGDVTDYYAGDLAHEGGVIPTDLSRSEMSGQILGHMLNNDPDAVWIIQCWWGNPEKAVLDGFGAENRANHLLVLDLNATVSSNYANTSSWGGREWNGSGWVFCMLDNYGGRPGVHGELSYMMTEILKANATSSHMKGIGLVSEGTQMNPVVQELLWEMAWRTERFDLKQWLHEYAARRYGAESEAINEAWDLLLETAYGYAGAHDFNVNAVVNMLPSFSPSAISGSATVNYDPLKFERATELFLSEFDRFADRETYVYDAVDLLKQLLSNSMANYFNTFVEAVNTEEPEAAQEMAEKFLSAVEMLDEVSSFEIDSTIGEWVGRIDRFAADERTGTYDDYALDMMRINAKAIITAWCSRILHTYAYRQYSGQLLDYNYPMWAAFFEAALSGSTLPSNRDYFQTAWDFVLSDTVYPDEALAARGSEAHRSLASVYEEIRSDYLWNHASELRSVICNVATRGTAYANNAQSTYPVTRLNDGDLTGLWIGTSSAFPTYAGILLDQEYPVDEVVITAETRGTPGADVMQYEIQALINGAFRTVAQAQSYDPETKKYTVTVRFDEPVVTSDIRVILLSKPSGSQIWPALAEIKVMSYSTPAGYPVALTVQPEEEAFPTSESGTLLQAAISAEKRGEEFLQGLQDGSLRLQVQLRDETGKATYLAEDWIFDDSSECTAEALRFNFGNYGVRLLAGHAYTLTLNAYSGDVLYYTGSSEEGAFVPETDALPVDEPAHACTVSYDPVPGDVNGDRLVTIEDVSLLLNWISARHFDAAGDVNGSGALNINDVTILLNMLAGLE